MVEFVREDYQASEEWSAFAALAPICLRHLPP
jgi:hypothetical protein